jgi:phosphoribulokinase
VLAELDRRERDAAEFIAPQRAFADIVVRFKPSSDPSHLDADLVLRDVLHVPDLSPLQAGVGGPLIEHGGGEIVVRIPGSLDEAHAGELEELLWERMRLAGHVPVGRLGEFTVGTDLRRSDPLALVQMLILYKLMSAASDWDVPSAEVRPLPRRATDRIT